jgi:hypothetical protein
VKEIKLSQNQITQVTDERYDFLNQWKWSAQWCEGTNSFYAVRTNCSNKRIRMHRVILNLPNSIDGDHIDGNTLNNQDDNLRSDPEHRNTQNQKLSCKNTSGYKGVTWDKQMSKWRSQIKYKGKLYFLGLFDILEDAARARDKKALELHGEFARLNYYF